jgi:hypothetical protein
MSRGHRRRQHQTSQTNAKLILLFAGVLEILLRFIPPTSTDP